MEQSLSLNPTLDDRAVVSWLLWGLIYNGAQPLNEL